MIYATFIKMYGMLPPAEAKVGCPRARPPSFTAYRSFLLCALTMGQNGRDMEVLIRTRTMTLHTDGSVGYSAG